MVRFSKRDLAIIAGLAGAADFLAEGRFSAPAARALKRYVLPAAGRAGISVAGTALGVTRLLLANPYILGGTAIYVGYHERDKIRSLLEQGYEIVQPAAQEILQQAAQLTAPLGPPGIQPPRFLDPIRERVTGKRKKSSFNIAVGKGMKAVKRSTKYGGKGKISPAKKVFAMVTKLASAKKKKRKAPKSGIRRIIWNAMQGLR